MICFNGTDGHRPASRGLAGNDTLFGGAGDDTLIGGDGDDLLNGGTGADSMDGGNGSDIYLVDGADFVTDTGTGGLDRVVISDVAGLDLSMDGWSGIELVNGYTGDDTIDASSFSTAVTIVGGEGDDVIIGGNAADFLVGSAGDDLLSGGDGNDLLFGKAGADTYLGGAGDDTVYLEDELDTFQDGGAGTDRAIIAVDTGLSIDVGSWVSVERVSSLDGNDTIDATGNTSGITLTGGNGDDALTGGAGADILLGQDGNDVLSGAGGNDTLIGSTGDDTFIGGAGNDLFIAGSGNDVFVFSDGFGQDIVSGYDDLTHILDFTGHSGVEGFADLLISQVGTDTKIALAAGGSDAIYLVDIDAMVIDETDFTFA
jgi:Ca2+-binding RTX toxin-like protein